jgi:hypothetical protein
MTKVLKIGASGYQEEKDLVPADITGSASTLIGQKSSGGVVNLTPAEARTILNVADGATANSKASNSDIDTGTDDVKFLTALALASANVNRVQYLTGTTSSTPTPTVGIFETTYFDLTAQAETGTFGVPTSTGTIFNHQKIVVRIKDNGTAQTLAWNSGAGGYRASTDLALPLTTVLGKTLYLGFDYNSADGKWDLLAVLNNI